MMNSQENAPKEGMVDVEQQNNTNPAEVEFSNETQAEPKTYKSKAEILERLKEIVGNEENPTKEELDNLKTTFYKIHIAERDAKQKSTMKFVWIYNSYRYISISIRYFMVDFTLQTPTITREK